MGDGAGLGDIFLDSGNLSDGGTFLRSDLLFEIGEELELEFTVPGTDCRICTRGRVAWVNPRDDGGSPPGMGIQFVDLSDDDKKVLAEFVANPNT